MTQLFYQQAHLGKPSTSAAASSDCRRLVQFVFLTQYRLPYMRKVKEEGKSAE